LHVKPLSGKVRERALELTQQYRAIAEGSLGQTRESLEESWGAIPTAPNEKKLALGLQKLLEDACEFESESPVEPSVLRAAVFEAAAQAWRNSDLAEHFERTKILQTVGEAHGMAADRVEQALYADLRSAQRLHRAALRSAESIVEQYDLAQVQAVLLRAVQLTATVKCSSVDAYRSLFRALKFHRLLYKLQGSDDGTYRIEIDGPFSLFENSTKYGLQLALLLPALRRADALSLDADLRWGKSRQSLSFHWESRRASEEVEDDARLPDELIELVSAFRTLNSGWKVNAAGTLIDLPGVGLCVPDLVFESPQGKPVYFELMGYWSRDAVWKRVEIAKAAATQIDAPAIVRARRASPAATRLPKMLFAVSSRLRVSEAALSEDDPAALYVFKGVMNPRSVLKKLESLVSQ
jgi:predicted nuclease of restriction endonuclease-like RecB superfamily